MTKFNIGDRVFYARCNQQEIEVPCLVCYGKLSVILTLGNGDEITLPCGYCGHGYQAPRGYIKEYDYKIVAELVIITGIETRKDQNGEEIKYKYNNYIFDEDRLFANQTEALEKAKEIKAKYDEEQKTKSEYLKKDAKKSFAWNAGYHLREAKNHRKQAEYHDTKAVLCKAKTKNEE